jgi:DNA-binding transcriptional MerR regulator
VTSAEIFSPDESPDDPGARAGKSDAAFRTISEVAEDLEVPQHVLRFWETKFTQVKPLKRGGGRRYYRPEDVVLLKRIRSLLYTDGMTIRGVQKMLRESGSKGLTGDAHGTTIAAPAPETPPSAIPGPECEDLSRLLSELTLLRDELRAAAR